MAANLFVVDDEPDIADLICEIGENLGYITTAFTTPSAFLDADVQQADVIVLDLLLPGITGIDLIRHLSEEGCKASLVLISGFDSDVLFAAQKMAKSYHLTVLAALHKPLQLSELEQALENPTITTIPYHQGGKQFTREEIEKGISAGEFIPLVQPKVSLTTGDLESVEALVRWQHPELGLLGAGEFLSQVENLNLIDPLTETLMEQAFSAASQWLQQGLDISVAVNFSSRSLTELGWPAVITRLLNTHNLTTNHLIIEVTESQLMADTSHSLDVLTRLRLNGIRVAVDDFGTGYSTMEQLQHAPFSELKIDQSFMQQSKQDLKAAAIVESLVNLANKLELPIVAEGIEDQQMWDYAKQLHCDQAQGFFVAEPMAADQLILWYQAWQQRRNTLIAA